MATDSSLIKVGASGTIRVAPVGTTQPADEDDVPAAGWVDMGFASEDGVTFNDTPDLTTIGAWQSFYPVRRIVTSVDTTVSFTLMEWKTPAIKFAFRGGTQSVVSAGHYKYVPPAAGTVDERALMVDWVDGADIFRLIIPKGMVTGGVETVIAKTDAATFAITYSATATGTGDPWLLLSNTAGLAT